MSKTTPLFHRLSDVEHDRAMLETSRTMDWAPYAESVCRIFGRAAFTLAHLAPLLI